MRNKVLLGIIILTVLIVGGILLFTLHPSYQKYVIPSNDWNQIVNSRKESNDLFLEKIQFNDYSLEIDPKNSILYYSFVRSHNQFNPSIHYSSNRKNIKLAFNKNITSNMIEKEDTLKVILYNQNYYHIYSLVVTDYPILSITYDKVKPHKKNISITFRLFDNHVDSSKRFMESDGNFYKIEDSDSYSISLKQESLGHNRRDNRVSIFGMPLEDRYVIQPGEDNNHFRFFINHQYMGIYSIQPMIELYK